MTGEPTRLFTRSDVQRLLDFPSCIAAVENAFRLKGEGKTAPSGVLGIHAQNGGFHAKAAILELSRPYFVVKINANFPANPSTNGLPTIQGVLVLFDATNGVPLAVMDSMAITTIRTASASAVAAKFLARAESRTATFIGCGVQARAHMAAISAVRPLESAFVFDIDADRATRFAEEMRRAHSIDVSVAPSLREATKASDIVVTTTSSTKPFLGLDDVSTGTFIAAVGADNEHKHEIEVELLASSVVVADDLDQCSAIGDLHHALDAGAVTRSHVRATLAEIVAGKKKGRLSDDEVIVLDSTGVAIEDVAAAAVVYERAQPAEKGLTIQLGS